MNKKLIKIMLVALLLRIVISPFVWHIDLMNHLDWGKRFWEYGPKSFYLANVWNFTWPNQPPATILMFALVRKLYEGVFNFLWFVNVNIPAFPSVVVSFAETNLYQVFIKLPAIFCDIGIGYLIYKIMIYFGQNKHALLGALVFLFNPVIWYNSAIWGQTDSIINFFVLLSFYFVLLKKPSLSMTAFIVSLFFKVSLVIFIPVYAIILFKNFRFKKIVKSIIPGIVLMMAFTFVFSNGSGKDPLTWLILLYKDKVLGQQLEVITANAFNLWAVVAGLNWQPHTQLLGPFSYKIWSYIVFTCFYIPVLFITFKAKKEKHYLWSFALSAFCVFMLLTNMHERYIYPLFPFFTILIFQYKKLTNWYILYSAIALINLYNLWWTPLFPTLKSVMEFSQSIILRGISLLAFMIFIYLYRFGISSIKHKKLR